MNSFKLRIKSRKRKEKKEKKIKKL